MQTLGWNNSVWFKRLRVISRVWATVVVGMFAVVAVAFCFGYTPSDTQQVITHTTMTQSKLYDFEVIDNKGNLQPMAQYKGKVLLIVNTATACGFTPPIEKLL